MFLPSHPDLTRPLHFHRDHTRGNAELVHLQPGLVIVGADERICALTRRLAHGEELQVSMYPEGVGRVLTWACPPVLTDPMPHHRSLGPSTCDAS